MIFRYNIHIDYWTGGGSYFIDREFDDWQEVKEVVADMLITSKVKYHSNCSRTVDANIRKIEVRDRSTCKVCLSMEM